MANTSARSFVIDFFARKTFLYFFPAIIFVLLVGFSIYTKQQTKTMHVFLFSLPVIFFIGGWSFYNYQRLAYFGITTLTGYNLTNHSGAFIEYAPEKYNVIAKIYLANREVQIANTDSHSMTIWRTIPEMMEKTGYSYTQLSRGLTRMSIRLFLTHPFLYGWSVLQSWILFWNEPGWWVWQNAHNEITGRVLGYLWRAEKYLLVTLNLIFLISVSYLFITKIIIKKKYPKTPLSILALVIIILTCSILQALVEYGENARYSMQVKPFVILVVMLVLTSCQKIENIRKQNG